MKKKKFSHSAKKQYTSYIQLSDFDKKLTKNFTIFRDTDIGITEYWQVPLIESVINFFCLSIIDINNNK